MKKESKKIYTDTIKVYNKLGRKYFEATLNPAPKERAGFIKRLKKGARILDVGCAGGRDMKEFTKKGFEAVGIDLSTVLLNIAKKEAPKGKYFKMDVLNLKFPKEHFDAIWADAVLLHLRRKDAAKAIKDLYRILKKDGVLYVSAKYGKGEKFVNEKPFTNYVRFYTYFTKKEMENLLKLAGFKIISSKFLPDDLHRPEIKWISILSKKLNEKPD